MSGVVRKVVVREEGRLPGQEGGKSAEKVGRERARADVSRGGVAV